MASDNVVLQGVVSGTAGGGATSAGIGAEKDNSSRGLNARRNPICCVYVHKRLIIQPFNNRIRHGVNLSMDIESCVLPLWRVDGNIRGIL